MSHRPVHLLRERGSYQAFMYMYKNLAPMPGHPLVTRRKQTEKIMAFRNRRHCGPCALEVTNLNAVASNLPRTCSKSQSLPNSVIFITELHLPVFLNPGPLQQLKFRKIPLNLTEDFRGAKYPIVFGSQKSNCRD